MQNIERIYFRDWSIEPGVRGDGAHEVTVRFSVRVDNDPTPAGQEFHRRFGYKIDIKGDPRDNPRGILPDNQLEHIFSFTRIGFRPDCRFRNGEFECQIVRSDSDTFMFPARTTRVGSDLDAGSLEYTTVTHSALVEAADLNVAEGREIRLPAMFGGGTFRLAAEDRIFALISIVELGSGRVVRTLRSHADREVYERASA